MTPQGFKQAVKSHAAELKARLILLDLQLEDQILAVQELQRRHSITTYPLFGGFTASHEPEMAGYQPAKYAAVAELCNNLINEIPSEMDPFPTLSKHRPDTANLHGQLLTEYTLELLDRTRIHDEVQEELRARWRTRENEETATQIAYELLAEMGRKYSREADTELGKPKADELWVKLTPAKIRTTVLMAFLKKAEACGL